MSSIDRQDEITAVVLALVDQYRTLARRFEAVASDVANEGDDRRIRKQLRALKAEIQDEASSLDESTRRWVDEQLPDVVAVVASVVAERTGLTGLTSTDSDDLTAEYGDQIAVALAGGLKLTAESLSSLLRAAGTSRFDDLLIGVTYDASEDLRRALAKNAIGVIYSNGARHSIADYAEMTIRTVVQTMVNRAVIEIGRKNGVKFYEITDGPSCGLESHNTGAKANGMIVDESTAHAYPIAHPRCVRRFWPRQEILTQEQAQAADPQFDEQLYELEQEVLQAGAQRLAARISAYAARVEAARAKMIA